MLFTERLSCVEGSKQFLALSPNNNASDNTEPEESSWRKSFAKSISWQFPKTVDSNTTNDTSPTTSSSLLTPLQVKYTHTKCLDTVCNSYHINVFSPREVLGLSLLDKLTKKLDQQPDIQAVFRI